MTTGSCCHHLPGSLCDCTSSTDPLKSAEEGEGGGCPGHCFSQVTTIDGMLLSSVLKPVQSSSACIASDGPMCRICHDGGYGEDLLSPCGCAGTLGMVHKSCLEQWLSSSNTSYCELCQTRFSIERQLRPFAEVTGVARRPRLTQREEDVVLRHSVLPVHHSTCCHFCLVVPAGSAGPSEIGQFVAGRRPHSAHHCPLHHLHPLDPGVFALPLSTVFRMEEKRPESVPDHS
uniref:E3 ubiquitin-protein ligase MARCHF2-like isoform X3 n=1 Tax=Doryrhamphus excisus TaxID=161450 RepID=UPI0025AE2D2B|nr:E3 ubiquitin-protein ligase MARCHF2-like isoform X3 [Doryrhamphus excisus]